MGVLGRLRPGVDTCPRRAPKRDTIAAGTRVRDIRSSIPADASRSVPLGEQVARDVRTGALALFGAVACVLFIACANVSSLMLARATGQHRDLLIRAALGCVPLAAPPPSARRKPPSLDRRRRRRSPAGRLARRPARPAALPIGQPLRPVCRRARDHRRRSVGARLHDGCNRSAARSSSAWRRPSATGSLAHQRRPPRRYARNGRSSSAPSSGACSSSLKSRWRSSCSSRPV